MVIFFSIPIWLIAFFALGSIAVASTFMSLIIFWVYLIIGGISWVFYFGFLLEKQRKAGNGSLVGLICSFAIGMLCTAIGAYIFSRKGAQLSGFIVVMLIDAIICIVSYLLNLIVSSKIYLLSSFILILGSILAAMWSVGYDISYTLKADYRNIAYFECTMMRDSGWGSTGKIYDSLDSSRRTIGSFEVGDIFSPYPKDFPSIYTPIQGLKYHNDDLWAIEYNGTIAYVPSVNFKPRYWRESEFVDEHWSIVIGWKRYGFLPDFFLHTCEYLFDRFPFGISFDLVSS